MIRPILLPLLLSVKNVVSYDVPTLTPENYTKTTDRHTLFVKFFAPWCGHSRKMAPDWEKLAKDWEGDDVGLIAQIDCTGPAKPLCDANFVKKFPTLKYGDPSALEFYEGPRSYEDMAAFAEANLTPICTPDNPEACDKEEKEIIQEYQILTQAEIEERIAKEKNKIKMTQTSFDAAVDRLQKEYQALVEAKERRIEDITSSDLRILKSIQKAAAKGANNGRDEL